MLASASQLCLTPSHSFGVSHTQETVTTCRERCGGQGYLSVNRFGVLLGFAHAGMTAEGDNRVLMQKVAKEYLATLAMPPVRARLQAGASGKPDLASEVGWSYVCVRGNWGCFFAFDRVFGCWVQYNRFSL